MPADTDTQAARAQQFRALHQGPELLLLPNPWDAGSARLFEWLGYAALATTSGGFAATLGRLDGGVSRDEALAHGAEIAAATSLPVSADLENAFADEPGRRGRDDPAGRRGRAGRLLGRGLHPARRPADLRPRAGPGPDRGGGRGGPGGPQGRWC